MQVASKSKHLVTHEIIRMAQAFQDLLTRVFVAGITTEYLER